MNTIAGCNIGSKTLLAEQGKLRSCSACLIDVFLANSLATCSRASGNVAR